MKILITGSSGQIGTNVGLALAQRGDGVLGIDKRANTWTDRFPTERIDMAAPPPANDAPLPAAIKTFAPDMILHLAAWAKVHELVQHPGRAFENVAMGYWSLEWARTLQVPIVFGSSREVYGDVLRHVTDESMADFVIAESPYSASKIAGEAFFSSYARCYNIRTLVFRFSNVYGRYDNDLERLERVIPLFVQRIWRGQPITVFGRDKMLDFTYIDDCVAGVVAGIDALAAGRVAGETINLACGQGHTLYDLVSLIELATGRQAAATYASSQTGEVTRYVADITKARTLLGYAPRTPLTRGIAEYVRWCRETGFIS